MSREPSTGPSKMCATVFEFKYRDIIIRSIYFAAVICYLFDPEPIGSLASAWLFRQTGSLSEALWKRAVLSVGVALVFIAALIRTWATSYLHYDVMRNPRLHTDRLIRDGPFGHLRNPLYLGNLFMVAGVIPILSRTGMVVLVAGSLLFIHRLVRREETELARTHGQSFHEYCRTVPRWLPSVRRPAGMAHKPSFRRGVAGELLLWIIALALAAYVATLDWKVFGMIFTWAFIPGAFRRFQTMRQRRS